MHRIVCVGLFSPPTAIRSDEFGCFWKGEQQSEMEEKRHCGDSELTERNRESELVNRRVSFSSWLVVEMLERLTLFMLFVSKVCNSPII